jgi:hypothetical protein
MNLNVAASRQSAAKFETESVRRSTETPLRFRGSKGEIWVRRWLNHEPIQARKKQDDTGLKSSDSSPKTWPVQIDFAGHMLMTALVQRFVAMLLALALGVAAAAPGATPASQDRASARSGSAPTCKCCNFDPANCVTPSCCPSPARHRCPEAPPSRPSSGSSELQGLAAALSAVWTLPRAIPNEVRVRSNSLLPLRAVPIFQRDCSFLI